MPAGFPSRQLARLLTSSRFLILPVLLLLNARLIGAQSDPPPTALPPVIVTVWTETPDLTVTLVKPTAADLGEVGVMLILVAQRQDAHLVVERLETDAGERIALTLVRLPPLPDALPLPSPVLRETDDQPALFASDQTGEAADFLRGLALYAAGDCPALLTAFKPFGSADGSEGTPDVVSLVAFYEGACALRRADFAAAQAGFALSIVYAPDADWRQATDAMVNLAWLNLHAGETEQAFQYLDSWLAGPLSTAELVEPYSVRAQFYALTFDYDAALADLNTALDLYYTTVSSPFDVDPAILAPLYVQRGQIYLLLYEWDQVLNDYNTALQLDPDYADVYYYRGVLYYTVRVDRANALADFEQYLALAPDGDLAAEASRLADQIRGELEALNE